MPDSRASDLAPRAEGWYALAYYAAYLAYLFWRPESEVLHWASLVAVPLLFVYLIRRRVGVTGRSGLLASFGIRRANWSRGLLWAGVLGLGISLLQVSQSRYADQIWEIIQSGRVVLLFPLVFVFMLVTAGFTEEFFFRGFIQTRLEPLFRSKIAALLVTSVLFGIYHVPYAYLNPNWPSAGDWTAAWQAALGQGIPGGLILGGVYLWSRHNLFATIVLHSLINAIPGMAMIRFSVG
ncbi:MAG TPA: type II CAAX endopeptidase family protein [Gemmatimonadales bacterium]|nr:type II CAAX endopeptidase family protein [Gemmatimonadales bacterium]